MYRKIVSMSLLVLLGFLFVVQVGAQSKMENIKDDIRIMESILEQLLQSSRNYSFNGRNIKGFYFDDYGLLFNVNMEDNFQIMSFFRSGKKLLEIEMSKIKEKAEKGAVVARSPGRLSTVFNLGMEGADFEEWEKKLDKKITTFMSTYVDNGNFLRKNDKVSVVTFFGNRSGEGPRAKVYQVTKGVISDVRREKISENKFDKRLLKQLISSDDNNENIDIMSNIIKTSLEGKRRSKVLGGGNVHGIFLKELGVMFSLSGRYFRDLFADNLWVWTVPETKEILEDFRAGVISEKSRKKETEKSKKFRENLSKFEDNIIKIVGQYGASSLKFLPDNQSVFILFGTEGYSNKDVSNVMIRLRKSDLVAYSREKLSMENLRKRAQIVEY